MIELVENGIGVVIGFEQGLDLATKIGVVPAGLVEGGGAVVGVKVDDRAEEGADLFSAFGCERRIHDARCHPCRGCPPGSEVQGSAPCFG